MLKLNLVYPERSDIKYKIVRFSDSQIQFTLDDPEYLNPWNHDIQGVDIISRMSWDDLQIIIAAKVALDELGIEFIWLTVPYFLGARSDRKFSEGGSNYLKSVICPIINDLDFAGVYVLDPHSDVLEACLNSYFKEDNFDLVRFALDNIYPLVNFPRVPADLHNFVLVSPDAGALKKIYDLAKKIHYTDDIIVASKHRDISTGNIIATTVPIDLGHSGKDIIIIDDICDGGRTFIEMAKVIKKELSLSRIYLIVTHGIFSQGFFELNNYFTDIFCTNSVYDVNPCGQTARTPKQLNIF